MVEISHKSITPVSKRTPIKLTSLPSSASMHMVGPGYMVLRLRVVRTHEMPAPWSVAYQ